MSTTTVMKDSGFLDCKYSVLFSPVYLVKSKDDPYYNFDLKSSLDIVNINQLNLNLSGTYSFQKST